MNYLSETEINNFMECNKKYFETSEIPRFKSIIADSNVTLEELGTFKFKSPTLGKLLSVVFGLLGIDRFYSGNYVLGALKLFTFGGSGIWWLIYWFLIGNAIRKDNQSKFYSFLTNTTVSNSFDTTMDNVKNVLKSKEVRNATKDLLKSTKDVIESCSNDI